MNDTLDIQITEKMIDAGMRVLIVEYDYQFDRLENDGRHFVTRIFDAMARAQRRDNPE